jgi:hypothetical protein
MSEINETPEIWTDEMIIRDLSSRYPDRKTTWIVFDRVSIYGSKGKDGNIFACADDNNVRSIAIQNFIKNKGGEFVTGE